MSVKTAIIAVLSLFIISRDESSLSAWIYCNMSVFFMVRQSRVTHNSRYKDDLNQVNCKIYGNCV